MTGLERRLGVELEWNPLSKASRAARARRAGRIHDALRLYLAAGEEDDLRECLRDVVPPWSIKEPLLKAVDALLHLRASAAMVEARGIPATLAVTLTQEATASAEALWTTAHRFAAAGAQRADASGIRGILDREVRRLAELGDAINQARLALLELTVLGGAQGHDLEKAEARLRALARARKEVEEALEEARQ